MERDPVPMTLIGILSLILGAWLTMGHYVLTYPFNGGAEDAFFTEALAGVVLLSYGYGRLRSPWHVPKLTAAAAAVGAWLIAAPTVMGYGAEVSMAQVNDVFCGVLAILLAGVAAVISAFQPAPGLSPTASMGTATLPRQATARDDRESPVPGVYVG